jgi:hypothetical protein
LSFQQKQQQISELLSKADDLATQQQTGGEVYHAMAESLGEAWKDLNAQLDLRRMLLDQSLAFHQSAKDVSIINCILVCFNMTSRFP